METLYTSRDVKHNENQKPKFTRKQKKSKTEIRKNSQKKSKSSKNPKKIIVGN